jgi:hypothetical protein
MFNVLIGYHQTINTVLKKQVDSVMYMDSPFIIIDFTSLN